jgi:hypothetical protein
MAWKATTTTKDRFIEKKTTQRTERTEVDDGIVGLAAALLALANVVVVHLESRINRSKAKRGPGQRQGAEEEGGGKRRSSAGQVCGLTRRITTASAE